MNRKSLAVGALCLGVALLVARTARGQRSFGTPATVIHAVAIKFTPDSTPEQRQRVLDGVNEMAAAIPGIKNVWVKATRVQPREFHAAFVIEFESRAAADAYVDHPAHREWESYYHPIRAESRSLQITNESAP